jgi:hypothetical protein
LELHNGILHNRLLLSSAVAAAVAVSLQPLLLPVPCCRTHKRQLGLLQLLYVRQQLRHNCGLCCVWHLLVISLGPATNCWRLICRALVLLLFCRMQMLFELMFCIRSFAWDSLGSM